MSVTAPGGFEAGGTACGIKANGAPDLALVVAGEACAAAGVFTRNTAAAAPVALTRRHVSSGRARAIVLNSGCANAATGAAGAEAAQGMARAVATRLGCPEAEVLVCSTGPIGEILPLDRVAPAVATMEIGSNGGPAAAAAILTTDSRTKEVVVSGSGYTVGGMAKGAGMIRPDMATMLAVLTTDARVEAPQLDSALRRAVDRTFNALNIDGCESTNDSVLLLASGTSGTRPTPDEFDATVEEACRALAAQMAADAEGASRTVTIEVEGAPDDGAALSLARAVADSALVRASFYGADPNWGRVLAALGASRVAFDPARVMVSYAGVTVAEGGVAAAVDLDGLVDKLAGDFTVSIDLGDGGGRCSLLTTDLTPDYVNFNSERS